MTWLDHTRKRGNGPALDSGPSPISLCLSLSLYLPLHPLSLFLSSAEYISCHACVVFDKEWSTLLNQVVLQLLEALADGAWKKPIFVRFEAKTTPNQTYLRLADFFFRSRLGSWPFPFPTDRPLVPTHLLNSTSSCELLAEGQ